MAGERVPRRLAAILAADVVEYSRMMGADESGTPARLKILRNEAFDRCGAGDSVIAEFAEAEFFRLSVAAGYSTGAVIRVGGGR